MCLKCEVSLLANVFGKFRNTCVQNFGLYPSLYLRTPALRWDEKLTITKVELDLISDVDMNLFLKKGLEVVFFYSYKRYIKANSKYLTSCDPKKPIRHITYLDKNNLYGYAMSNSLPMGVFKWLDPVKFNLDKCKDDRLRDSNLDVDLEYPNELQE